jgi:alcohol dehydrogenase
LASPLGAYFPIPHGVVCGTLVGAATQINITALLARQTNHAALTKYAQVGRLLNDRDDLDDQSAQTALVELLNDWSEKLELPRLGAYGIQESDFPLIVANSRGSSMLTNPIVLTDEEITAILDWRL